MKSDRRDLSRRSKAVLRAASPLISAITGEVSSSVSDDLVEPQAPKTAQLRMMARADSLTRIIAFVREGMTQINILTSNCTLRLLRPQGERFSHRAGWEGAAMTSRPLFNTPAVLPLPRLPVYRI